MRLRARTDEGLLEAAAAGDDEAFARFYRRWLGQVSAFHLKRTRSPELALDLTAETFAAVVAGLRGYDRRRGSAVGWLFSIAENKLVDSARRARVESVARERLAHEPIAYADEDLDRVEQLAASADGRLERLLAELPAEQRDAIRARVLGEKSYSEIAAHMSCSEAVVRQRVSRGLSRLRERVKEAL